MIHEAASSIGNPTKALVCDQLFFSGTDERGLYSASSSGRVSSSLSVTCCSGSARNVVGLYPL